MKVALCYHGIAKGYNFKNGGLPVGYEHEFDLITKNLIDYNKDCQFDIYLHSWSKEYEELILAKMNPKRSLFEHPKKFKRASPFKILKEKIKKFLGKGFEIQRINNIYSRWYSFKRVCNLIKQTSENYDLVIVTRFDMCLLSPLDLSKLNAKNFYSGDWVAYYEGDKEVTEEDFNISNQSYKKVSKGYPFDDEGLQDFFFISSQEYMISKFCTIFDNLELLISKFGPSNHTIAKGKLLMDGLQNRHKRILTYGKDYFLSRWI